MTLKLQRMSCFGSVIFLRSGVSEVSLVQLLPPGIVPPCPTLRNPAERPLFKTLVEELRDLYLVPPPCFFFKRMEVESGVPYLPGSFSMIVKARRVRKMHIFFRFFWMAEIAPKCQQCLRGQCGKAGSCEGPAI